MHRSPEKTRSVDSQMIVRFDSVERLVHWTNALLFMVLILTALPLYFAQVESLVGRRALIAEIHTWTGVILPLPLLIALSGSWGSGLRADIRRFNLWTKGELKWLMTAGKNPGLEMGKFNPGQKMNAIFVGSSIVVMFCTGFVLGWFNFFPLSWRTGATFVHDVFAGAIVVVIAGHIVFALANRHALMSMISGRISKLWASQRAPRWLAEEQAGHPEI